MAPMRFRGTVLRAHRLRLGLTQRELAERADLASPGRIAAWERGVEQPSASYVPKLARALGVSALSLYGTAAKDPDFKTLLMAAGLSLLALSAASGVPYTTCQRIEHGVSRPSQDAVAQLAAALECTPEVVTRALSRIKPGNRRRCG
ncbi:MAG: putative transcriptional repressor [Pseudonocardiales bacterium]|nr:putative transcriptional repressor [Pseudonocardiales bacterium]